MFRSIPTVTRNLLIINILCYLAQVLIGPNSPYLLDTLSQWCGLRFFLAPDFHFYQLFTYMFLHGSFYHLFGNMFALWMFGRIIEQVWGPKKFLFYYIFCGIGAGLTQEILQVFTAGGGVTIGASGAIFGILLAFGMIYPNEKIFIIPIPVPIKAKWFVIFYAALELFLGFNAGRTGSDNVAHMAHIGGMLFGLLLILYWRRQEQRPRVYRRPKDQEVKFNQTATREDDMAYNARKRERQEEVDRILDKIRKSGYDSLTKEEKQRLFEASRER
ncbi:MAG: rhomboid family intramembrane serine protease [Prevotella sp.]|nr:rhomboid family intramembrane serine protease [Prevotella sp.]